jgi:hypothetical protein
MRKLPESETEAIAKSLERVVELMEIRHIDAAPILEAGPLNPQSAPGMKDGGSTGHQSPETAS